LELAGTGFRSSTDGGELQLALGFSHPVIVKAPEGIKFEVKENKITVLGANKTLVGEVAAKIRRLKPADPYKLKGFKYENEVIIKKAGKAAKAGV
jgi:large subunit ribosomal protein L6